MTNIVDSKKTQQQHMGQQSGAQTNAGQKASVQQQPGQAGQQSAAARKGENPSKRDFNMDKSQAGDKANNPKLAGKQTGEETKNRN